MIVAHVEVLVEERSAEVALSALLPRMLGETTFAIYEHTCKEALLARLPERFRGYAKWLPSDWRVVVLLDRDGDDCVELKRRVDHMAQDAGLSTRATGNPLQVVSRLAIEELEAWYFGDWDAVRAAYPRVSDTISSQSKYRNPDAIRGGTWEAFERILQRAGYFPTGLRKIDAARAVAAHMDPARNTSASFRALGSALAEMARA